MRTFVMQLNSNVINQKLLCNGRTEFYSHSTIIFLSILYSRECD